MSSTNSTDIMVLFIAHSPVIDALHPLFTNNAVHLLHASTARAQQKTDVAEHPQVFRHIGLLFNEPPGVASVLFI